MQNKGFVKVFAVLLTLVCMFYLSFSFVTRHYNSKAAEYAGGDPVKESSYLDSLSTQKVWLGYTLKQCREMEISLGLDLKGGMNVVLELNVADVIRSLSNNNQDENFNKALDLAYAHQATSQKDFIDLFAEEYKKLDNGARLSAIFSTFELKDKITPQSSDAQVIAVLKEELKSAIDNSFNVLRTRIDRFGVVSPNIQRLETAGRILVELPGVKEPERVRKLLQGSANLEFWETYNLPEIYQQLVAADNMLATILKSDDTAAVGSDTTAIEATEEVVADNAAAETTNDADSLLAKIGEDKPEAQAAKSMEEFAKQHPLFAVLQINQYNGQLAPGPVVGIADKKDIAKINEYLNMKQVKDILPRNLSLKWGVKAIDEKEQYFYLYAIKMTNRDGTPALGGDVVTDANADFVQQAGRSEQQVSMTMNAEGAKAWARLTKENIGKAVAIVLDDMVYSAPNVQVEITGGRSQITGHFTPEEAKDLANVLKSGKMAASVHIVQEDVVGPSLGQEAINSGVISFVLALILLMFYMCAFYGVLPGLIADGALVLNIFFTMGILASFQAVLTLPGIAGMVLTLGMAVDANVLIYERIQEEIRAGKGLKLAIKEGYSNAYSAIIDGQLTTLLTGFILYYFGEGPIKGFATTLIIGILSSLFTAIFITRLILERAASKSDNVTFTTPLTANWLRNTKFPFLKKRKISYTISGIVIVLCFVSLFTRGLDKGIDFVGGRTYTVTFAQDVQVGDVAEKLAEVYGSAPEVKTVGTANNVKITTKYRIAETGAEVDANVDSLLYIGLQEILPAGTDYETFRSVNLQQTQKIGPAVAEDMTRAAVWSVLFALIGIFIYIMVRFSRWQYGAGAVVGLAHNTIIVIGAFSLFAGLLPFSLEVDQSFIAAVLTVVGYTINDTVVVFDRIREYRKLYPKRDDEQVVNDALNSTLRRTFSTSLSTIVVLLAIFVFGGASIKGFIFALLVGIIVGTYSSLFIATPISFDLTRRFKKKVEEKK